MCEYSGRSYEVFVNKMLQSMPFTTMTPPCGSYEVFVNKMLQSCCSLTATHVQCYCDRRAVTLQCGLQ